MKVIGLSFTLLLGGSVCIAAESNENNDQIVSKEKPSHQDEADRNIQKAIEEFNNGISSRLKELEKEESVAIPPNNKIYDNKEPRLPKSR